MTAPALLCPPTFLHVPEHVGTYGDEVADLAESVGLALDPEQRLAVDVMYAHDARGRLVSVEYGCAAPRQNIKTHVGKAAALADLVLFDEPMCLWTAHLRATAYEVFFNSEGTGLGDLFDNQDHLRRLVDSISDSDGEQTITLRRPGVGRPKPRLRFMTRSERGGRGLTGRRVTFDEALFLKASMTSAMVPILSAQSMSGAVQVRYLGSPGLPQSEVWRGVRDRGRSGVERRLAWLEWMAPRRDCEAVGCTHAVGVVGCVLDDPELVRAANLAVDRRMDIEFVLGTERPSMEPANYMRERLGWWDEPAKVEIAIPSKVWQLGADRRSAISGQPLLAVSMSPDRATCVLAAGGVRSDGLMHTEIVLHGSSGDWFVKKVAEVARNQRSDVAVVPNHPAGSLIPELEREGIRLLTLSGADYTRACGAFYDMVMAGKLRYVTPQPELTAAVGKAGRKPVGDSWRWSGDEITALVAATEAVYAALKPTAAGKGRAIALA